MMEDTLIEEEVKKPPKKEDEYSLVKMLILRESKVDVGFISQAKLVEKRLGEFIHYPTPPALKTYVLWGVVIGLPIGFLIGLPSMALLGLYGLIVALMAGLFLGTAVTAGFIVRKPKWFLDHSIIIFKEIDVDGKPFLEPTMHSYGLDYPKTVPASTYYFTHNNPPSKDYMAYQAPAPPKTWKDFFQSKSGVFVPVIVVLAILIGAILIFGGDVNLPTPPDVPPTEGPLNPSEAVE